MTLCTGDAGTPQRKSFNARKSIRSTSQRFTFLLRTVFALDVLLARCPIELPQRTKDVLPSPSSWCTLISNPSRLCRTGSLNMLLPSTMISPLTPGLCPFTPKLQQLQLPKIFLKWCMSNIMCMSLAGCPMPAESTNLICLIKHSLRKELIYQSAPRTPMQNGHAERLGCTLRDKAKCMWHQACIPDSWWEFVKSRSTLVGNPVKSR